MTYIDTGVHPRHATYDDILRLEEQYPSDRYTVAMVTMYDSKGHRRWESNSLVAPHEDAKTAPSVFPDPQPEPGFLRLQWNNGERTSVVYYAVHEYAESGEPRVSRIPQDEQEFVAMVLEALEALDEIEDPRA